MTKPMPKAGIILQHLITVVDPKFLLILVVRSENRLCTVV